MKKTLLFLFAVCCLSRFGLAQERCASILNVDSIQKYNPARYKHILQMEEHLERYLEELDENITRSIPDVIRIPVVVHVLHNGEPIGTGLNIGMAQIESQIDVLNEDFRRLMLMPQIHPLRSCQSLLMRALNFTLPVSTPMAILPTVLSEYLVQLLTLLSDRGQK